VHDMLQRMNELATKSANGTNSQEERDYIQSEVDALINEIDRVAETTKFNEIYLLKGDGTETKTKTETVAGKDAVAVQAEYVGNVSASIAKKSGATTPTWYLKGSTTALADDDAIMAQLEVDEATGKVVVKKGVEIYTQPADSSTEFGKQLTGVLVNDAAVQAIYEATDGRLSSANDGTAKVNAEDLYKFFNTDGSIKDKLYKQKTDKTGWVEVGADQIEKFVKVTKGSEKVDPEDKEVSYEVTKALEFNLHVGAEGNDDNKITVKIEAMSAKGIGIDSLKTTGVKTEEGATAAIETIKASIKKVSQQRSDLGAVQNRLEHTINNLDNIVENTQSAESAIRDTDMATEMVKYANNNILAQAGQSMLAQANQANQGVLALLG
ncbi:MAG: flagellin, partial [Butyrivibrio sp.]|nr:flagellin [Butyrivibrio sp.]